MLSIEASGKAPEPPHSELLGGFRATPPGLRGAALLGSHFFWRPASEVRVRAVQSASVGGSGVRTVSVWGERRRSGASLNMTGDSHCPVLASGTGSVLRDVAAAAP